MNSTAAVFATTHWSVVLAAGQQSTDTQVSEALEQLCRTYWYPLYAYIRRRGRSPEDAQDLTQEFLARLLDRHAFAQVKCEGGKFRSFLLTALNHFLVNEWKHGCAQKRDEREVAFSFDALNPETRYQCEPVDETTPEVVFNQQWAAALLELVLHRLQVECVSGGKADLFQRLQPCLTGAEPMLPYADLAVALGLTENAVKMAVHRLRQRYGELVRAEILQTVASPQEADEEIRHLIAIPAH